MRKIALVGCSNPVKDKQKNEIKRCIEFLKRINVETKFNEELYQELDGKQKAEILIRFYEDDDVEWIADVSGGDLANECLSFIDFERIRQHPKTFVGYSDLTTIINAIYSQTQQPALLYQIRYLPYQDNLTNLTTFRYRFIQSNHCEGIVVGGNIRCFLKLAGTPYFPDLNGKILFLESFGGQANLITSFLYQLKQLNAFQQINGLVLGTFTTLESDPSSPKVEDLAVKVIDNPKLPIVKTDDIGHSPTSKAIWIGKHLNLKG